MTECTLTTRDVYSTDEVKTNKIWIDGKPIYRKTFSVDTVVSDSIVDVGLVDSNLDNICFITGTLRYTTSVTAVFNRVGVNTQDAFVDENKHLKMKNSNYAGKMNITLEYTKTTD